MPLWLVLVSITTQAWTSQIEVPTVNYPTITAAVAVAHEGDTIHVAPGTYSAAKGEFFPLRLDKAIALEGDPNNKPHIQGDNGHTAVLISSGGVTVRGFRITDARGSEGINSMDGGGICVFVGPGETRDVNIADCLIEDCICPNDETYDGCGGGIYCGGTYCLCFKINISDCTIRDNVTPGCGGGVFCALLSNVSIRTTLLQGNVADDRGGGLFVDVFAWLDMTHCDVIANECPGDPVRPDWGGKGGGLACESYGLFTLAQCSVLDNRATYFGGGIFTQGGRLDSGSACSERPPASHVSDSNLAGNCAGSAGGGAYLAGSGELGFSHTRFYRNDAKKVDDKGKAVFDSIGANGGAVFVAAGKGRVSFDADCLIEGNEATSCGGGVYLAGGAQGTFDSTDFLGNSSVQSGGALLLVEAGAVMNDCLIACNNSARSWAGGIRVTGLGRIDLRHCSLVGNFAKADPGGVYADAGAIVDIRDSILWRNPGGSVGANGATVTVATSLNEDGANAANGVLGGDPRYVAWGSLDTIHVDASVPGPGVGTAAAPYRDLQSALNSFDLRLAADSPCLTTAGDGGNMGAETGTGGTAGNVTAALQLANGTYDIRGRNIVFTKDIRGNDPNTSAIQHAVLGCVEGASVERVCITGEDIFGGITVRADVNFVDCRVADNMALADGAGVYIAQGHCVMTDTLVSRNDCTGHTGGGLYLCPETTLDVVSSRLEGNRATNGAGLGLGQNSVASLLSDTAVSANAASNVGGGVYLEGTVSITDANIVENTAVSGGGICVQSTGTLTLHDSSVSSNRTSGSGGGLRSLGRIQISGSIFQSNSASDAGALDMVQERVASVISNTQFNKNTVSDWGGALYVNDNTAPSFTDCNFLQNTASRGAGVGCGRRNSKAVFDRCQFNGNRATSSNSDAGAFHLLTTQTHFRDCSFADSSAGDNGGTVFLGNVDASVFERCNIVGSSAGTAGGAIYLGGTAHPTFLGGSIQNARATYGGGIYSVEKTRPQFTDLTFSNCQAVLFGGGFFASSSSDAAFERCKFIGNATTGVSADGGGAFFRGSAKGQFVCCTFMNNVSNDDGGGVGADEQADLTFRSTLFVSNTAKNTGGGTFFTSKSTGTLQNCTLFSNKANGLTAGGIYTDSSGTVKMDSSIVWKNTPEGIPQGTHPAVSYCCVQGTVVWPGTGNILSDPLLDPTTFHLLDGSPCVDAGNPASGLNDACPSFGKGTSRNDMGMTGGPDDCNSP